MGESDASRGNTMAEGAEKKIKDIEEELRVVGANMQQLEIGEEKTMAREEASQAEILELIYKLKRSEYRGEQAEMSIQRLNVRIDQVEEDLLSEKYKIKKISDDLNQTFEVVGVLEVVLLDVGPEELHELGAGRH